MSRAELQRFTEDLAADATIAEEFRALGDDPAAWRERAAVLGYELSVEEAGGLSSSFEELSDDQLEAVAGGWDSEGPRTGGTNDDGEGT